MSTQRGLKQKLYAIWPLLDERTRRVMAANEALSLGFGGISEVHRACGLSRKAIAKGMREIQEGIVPPTGRIRCPGAGRKSITESNPRLLEALEALIDSQTPVIRNLPCDGFARARGQLQRNSPGRNIWSATRRWRRYLTI